MMRTSAKHQSAPKAKNGANGAQPYGVAPIRTMPAPGKETKNFSIEYWHWRVQFPDRDPLEIFCHPDADHAEVMRQYPDAIDLEPIPEPPRRVLSPSGKWYFTKSETDA